MEDIKKAASKMAITAALFSIGASAAFAGPCNTAGRDAGSGDVPGYVGRTIGSTATKQQHPPTAAMNKAVENIATSSEDAKRQTQGQPTGAQQSEETKPAPSEQSQKMTAGTAEQTQPAPTEDSKKMTAGAGQPALSEKQPVQAPGKDC